MNASEASQADPPMNQVARVLLAGALLPGKSPLRFLNGNTDVVCRIFTLFREIVWAAELIFDKDACAFVQDVEFPPPRDRYCNMMPILAKHDDSVPVEFQDYLPLIEHCREQCHNQNGVINPCKVWYLTVHESFVGENDSQRRPGIHIEGFLASRARRKRLMMFHRWGWHSDGETFSGGIFHASTVSRSCRMWDTRLPRRACSALSKGCDIEHMRDVLNRSAQVVETEANALYWMSDTTPHESVALKEGRYRQYFRLVAGEIDAWWEQHSTKNPLGIEPDCNIFYHSKFDSNAYTNIGDRGSSSEDSVDWIH